MNKKEKNDLKIIIDKIVKDAFKRINYAYQHHREKEKNEDDEPGDGEIATRLIFPKYANNGIRISEQELRFAFVEAFNASQDVKEKKLFYSIETPTEKRYKGFSKGKPDVVKEGKQEGRSGEFDLVIFNNQLDRVCLIEFKAKCATTNAYKKDLLKLNEEGQDRLRYFINILETCEQSTVDSIQDKIDNFYKKHKSDNGAIIWLYSLNGPIKEKVIVK